MKYNLKYTALIHPERKHNHPIVERGNEAHSIKTHIHHRNVDHFRIRAKGEFRLVTVV